MLRGRACMSYLFFELGVASHQFLLSPGFNHHIGSDQKTQRKQHEENRIYAAENVAIIVKTIQKGKYSQAE